MFVRNVVPPNERILSNLTLPVVTGAHLFVFCLFRYLFLLTSYFCDEKFVFLHDPVYESERGKQDTFAKEEALILITEEVKNSLLLSFCYFMTT